MYFRSPFSQDFAVALRAILALPSRDVKWCDINGEPLSFVGPTVPAELVSKDPSLADLAQLRFRHPDYFQAGSLHNHVDFWEDLFSSAGYTCPQVDLLQIVREGVRVDSFFRHFKGNFKGKSYDSAVPPISIFPNSPCCHQFTDFIDTTVLAWVSQGVIKVYGKIGECSPPHLVLPLTVEPSKPRLCHDERFLNLWIQDLPFKLDHLPDLPRYVLPGHFQTTFDDKNGYQHLKIHPDSQEFFSFSWRGYYFSFCTLPFGWKASAFLYHNVGLVVTSAARSLGVPVSQYIDDRHVGQLFLSGPLVCQPSRQLARAAAFILLFLLISAGYFVNLAKSSPQPSTFVKFLGFISDSVLQAFLVPLDKKEKFKALRDELLESSFAPIKSLQRFAGKALSFSLAIPACKLYVREVFKAISAVAKNSKLSVPILGPLRQELQEWIFLDNWSGHLPWRSEHHLSVTMFSDASQRAWGAVLVKDGLRQQIRDYWIDLEGDINTLEARALCNALSSFFPSIRNARIDVWTDNATLRAAWENGGCRSSLVNQELKKIEEMSRAGNFVLHLKYVPSSENIADAPSRALTDIDCSLSEEAWARVQARFGPHTFDLMSLDSNCRRGRDGSFLPHYSPWPTPYSLGVNVFAQPIPIEHNVYVFPPFVLVGPLLRYFFDQRQRFAFTIVVPRFRPHRYWWAILQAMAVDSFLLGRKGDPAVLLFPSRTSPDFIARPLPWDLWVFRCVCSW